MAFRTVKCATFHVLLRPPRKNSPHPAYLSAPSRRFPHRFTDFPRAARAISLRPVRTACGCPLSSRLKQPRTPRRRNGRRPCFDPQMRKYLRDHIRLLNPCPELVEGTAKNFNLPPHEQRSISNSEHALQSPRPTHAHRYVLRAHMVVRVPGHGRGLGHHLPNELRTRCLHAMKVRSSANGVRLAVRRDVGCASSVGKARPGSRLHTCGSTRTAPYWVRCKRRCGTRAASRCMSSIGLRMIWVVPLHHADFSFSARGIALCWFYGLTANENP